MSEHEPEEPEEVEVDPVSAVQNALSEVGRLVVGFACIAETLEEDGSTSIEVIHTDMPPWHMAGMLDWAKDMCSNYWGTSFASASTVDDEDDDF